MAMQKEGFDALVLPKGHKELAKALVEMHSNTQSPQMSTPATEQNFQLDLVRGKGFFSHKFRSLEFHLNRVRVS